MLRGDRNGGPRASNGSQRVLAELLVALPDAVIVLDTEGRVQWGNAAAEALFGRQLDDSVGLLALDLVHRDDLELVLRSFESVQRKDVGSYIEVRVRLARGWGLLEVVGTPVTWQGRPAVLFSMRDLTQRRRYEVAHNEEAGLRSLVQSTSSLFLLVSATGRVNSASGALTRMLGHDPEEVEHRHLAELVSESDRPALTAAFERARQRTGAAFPVTVVVRMLRHGGQAPVPFELSLVNLLDDPTVGGFVVSAHDVTARLVAEDELRRALALLRATFDSTADGILAVDKRGRMTNLNRRFAEMWHLPDSVVASLDTQEAIAFLREQVADRADFDAKVASLRSNSGAEVTYSLECRDGRIFDCHSRSQLIDGTVVGRVWSFRDVTEHRRLENELSHQAFHDSLTGLANKALFEDHLHLAMARAQRVSGQIALLFLDLDDFKAVNDRLGHAAGDELLRASARALEGCLRSSDTAARLGGDEFVVLLEEMGGASNAVGLAERIVEVFRVPFTVGGQQVRATASVGVAFGVPGVSSEQLLGNADAAMYVAKRQGKNRYVLFEPDLRTDGRLSRL